MGRGGMGREAGVRACAEVQRGGEEGRGVGACVALLWHWRDVCCGLDESRGTSSSHCGRGRTALRGPALASARLRSVW